MLCWQQVDTQATIVTELKDVAKDILVITQDQI